MFDPLVPDINSSVHSLNNNAVTGLGVGINGNALDPFLNSFNFGSSSTSGQQNFGHGSTANWFVQFWNNLNQSGNTTWSRTDPAGELRFDAGQGAPANTQGIPADNFSARWTTRSYFEGGLYDFVSQADDGIRIYIDSIKILDKWQDQPYIRNDAYVLVPKGHHNVQVDYFDNKFNAINTLRWDSLSQLTDWNGSIDVVGYDGDAVHSTYVNTFQRNGSSTIGAPTNNVHPWGNGYTQDFAGGTDGVGAIVKSNANDNSYWVGGDFWKNFLETGGAGGILGYATSDRYNSNGALRQDFQGGSIFKTARDVFALYGGIGSYYFQTAGGEKGRLGLPTSGEQGVGNGIIIRQNFENGYILWNGAATGYNSDGSLLFPPKLNSSLNYVDFSGVVMSTIGVNLRNSPQLSARTNLNRAYNERLSFDGWTTGETVMDLALGTPDNRWFHVAGTNLWVPSAYINGNPPSGITYSSSPSSSVPEALRKAIIDGNAPGSTPLPSLSNNIGDPTSGNNGNFNNTLTPVASNKDWLTTDNKDPQQKNYWSSPDSDITFGSWAGFKNVPLDVTYQFPFGVKVVTVENIAQEVEENYRDLFNLLDLPFADKHMEHFLDQNASPQDMDDIPVEELLQYVPGLQDEYGKRINQVKNKLREYSEELRQSGKRLQENTYWINPEKMEGGWVYTLTQKDIDEGKKINPKDLNRPLSQGIDLFEKLTGEPLRILNEAAHGNLSAIKNAPDNMRKLLDFYNALGRFEYNISVKVIVKEDSSISFQPQMYVHDYFNFDIKPDEFSKNINVGALNKLAAWGMRFGQSIVPETLVNLGMANNYEQSGKESSSWDFKV